MPKKILAWCLPALCVLGIAAHAEPGCYATYFSQQHASRGESFPHTFATFARVDETDRVESAWTISWMSEVPGLGVRKGVNRSLEWTIEKALAADHRVSYWGPFRVGEGLCRLAESRVSFLESGRARYNLLDGSTRRTAFHCVHAVSDLDASPFLKSGWATGDSATHLVAKHLAKWIAEPGAGPEYPTHPWLLKPLGVAKFPLVARALARR